MKRRTLIVGGIAGLSAEAQQPDAGTSVKDQVAKAERGFAASMAKRDPAAFASFLSDEAVFFGNNPAQPALRGKRAISDAWKNFFEGPNPPFSWDPDTVEPLDSGKLALTSGPVKNAQGDVIARFTSIWRLEANGQWRIVFDKGSPICR